MKKKYIIAFAIPLHQYSSPYTRSCAHLNDTIGLHSLGAAMVSASKENEQLVSTTCGRELTPLGCQGLRLPAGTRDRSFQQVL